MVSFYEKIDENVLTELLQVCVCVCRCRLVLGVKQTPRIERILISLLFLDSTIGSDKQRRFWAIKLLPEDRYMNRNSVLFHSDFRSPDSLVLPRTGWLQGPVPIPLTAWTLTSYSVHSSRSSMVNSLSRRSPMMWIRARPCEPAREYWTL